MIDYHVIRSLNNLMCHMTACTIYNCFVSIAISVAPVAKHLLQGQEVLDGGVPQQCKVRDRQHSLHLRTVFFLLSTQEVVLCRDSFNIVAM